MCQIGLARLKKPSLKVTIGVEINLVVPERSIQILEDSWMEMDTTIE